MVPWQRTCAGENFALPHGSAVAANQPTKNRVLSSLSNFAQRLAALIRGVHPGSVSVRRPGEDSLASPSAGSRSLDGRLPESFEALALELFALQFETNDPYRRLCIARGRTPKHVGCWTEIPAAPTEAFKDLDLTCLTPKERRVVFHSSGTSGQRASRHFHCPESLTLYATSVQPWFQQHLLGDIDVSLGGQSIALAIHQVSLTPAPDAVPNSSLAYMLGVLDAHRGGRDSVFVGRLRSDGFWTLDFDALHAALQRSVSANRPVLLMGTAFNFVDLIDQFESENIQFRLSPGSRIMETGGYKGQSRALPKEELHARLVGHLGIPEDHIVSEYGMSELSSQAYDHSILKCSEKDTGAPVRGIFFFPPWARVRVISPETQSEVSEGETGLIQVTDLANVASVLAVQTSDLGIRRGDGFELRGRAPTVEPRGCSLMTA